MEMGIAGAQAPPIPVLDIGIDQVGEEGRPSFMGTEEGEATTAEEEDGIEYCVCDQSSEKKKGGLRYARESGDSGPQLMCRASPMIQRMSHMHSGRKNLGDSKRDEATCSAVLNGRRYALCAQTIVRRRRGRHD
jgi:hypothetical protein